MTRITGTVRGVNRAKSFCFIRADEEFDTKRIQDTFAPFDAFLSRYQARAVENGTVVEFERYPTERGPRARAIAIKEG